jgi:hypothetical protein
MKKEELNRLISKYYTGTSTKEDEKELISFFGGNDIPDGYEAEKAIFRYLEDASKIPEPSPDLDARIIAGLDFSENQGRFRRLLIALAGVAAAIIIMTGSWFFFANSNKPGDTFTDPQLAYEETLKILYDVSSRMNQGAAAMEPFTKINSSLESLQVLSKSTETIQNSFRSLHHLQNAMELTQPAGAGHAIQPLK